jgi:hypothetical protein
MQIDDHAKIGDEQFSNRIDNKVVESVAARAIKDQEGANVDDETHKIKSCGADRPPLLDVEAKPRSGEGRIAIRAGRIDIGPSQRMRNADPASEYGDFSDGLGRGP